jgi:hypothetical protein
VIIFDLRCAPQGHVFEAWFGSSADYGDQQARGLVACPLCGSAEIAKAPMAPAVSPKGNAGNASDLFAGAPAGMKAMLAAAAAMQKSLIEKSEAVGDRFADEARAIHLGEADARAIHGRATPAEAASLVEEGIPVAPLPFPIADPGAEN